ncbi:MAG: protein kinase [Pirellulaceae bacterium]
MSAHPRKPTSDLVIVDPVKLQFHIQRSCVSKTQFAERMGVGRTSLYRMLDGLEVRRSLVLSLAHKLAVPMDDLLQHASPPPTASSASPWNHGEWELIPATLSAFTPLSNGLVMRSAKVRHRLLSHEFGRAKVYDVGGMPAAVRDRCRQALTRHAEAARRLRGVNHVAHNLTMTSSADGAIWTSVDRWFDGVWLDELTDVTSTRAAYIMQQVGLAIVALHQAGIVARELSPRRILVNAADQVLVTDLELCKLLDAEGSVSHDWLRNPFRAPEVVTGTDHHQADYYSFARIYLSLAATHFSSDGAEPTDDERVLEPFIPQPEIRRAVVACLSPIWHQRPTDIRPLVSQLQELCEHDN